MYHHKDLSNRDVLHLIKNGKIQFAGWEKGKIYGHLNCQSGKQKMSRESRVFFKNEKEALEKGFRPCAFCMPTAYKIWKGAQSAHKLS